MDPVLRPADWAADRRFMPRIVELVLAADRGFYALARASDQALAAMVENLLLGGASELGLPRLLLLEDEPAGLTCAAPTPELPLRVMRSLAALSALSDRDFGARLTAYRTGLPPLPEPSLYLSRLAVTAPLRGRGLGRLLLEDVEAQARSLGLPAVSLHVAADNRAAVGFYRAMGYREEGPADLAYLTLAKAITA